MSQRAKFYTRVASWGAPRKFLQAVHDDRTHNGLNLTLLVVCPQKHAASPVSLAIAAGDGKRLVRPRGRLVAPATRHIFVFCIVGLSSRLCSSYQI